jgi:hypothetical protein
MLDQLVKNKAARVSLAGQGGGNYIAISLAKCSAPVALLGPTLDKHQTTLEIIE